MPKLERSQWYDLCRDMHRQFKYVTEAEVFPEALSQSCSDKRRVQWNQKLFRQKCGPRTTPSLLGVGLMQFKPIRESKN